MRKVFKMVASSYNSLRKEISYNYTLEVSRNDINYYYVRYLLIHLPKSARKESESAGLYVRDE